MPPASFWLDFAIHLAYILPSYCNYAFQIYVIWFSKSKKRFRTPFYLIYALSAVNDIVLHSLYTLDYRFVMDSDFADIARSLVGPFHAYTLYVFVMMHTGMCHPLLVVLMSANRFMVLALDDSERSQFWRRWTKWLCAACFLLPLGFTGSMAFSYSELEMLNGVNEAHGYLIRETAPPTPWFNRGLQMAIMQSSSVVVCFILNSGVCFKLWKQQKSLSTVASNFRAEVMLFVYSCICFILESVVLVFQLHHAGVLTLCDRSIDSAVRILKIQNYVIDAQFLFPGWFLFIISSKMRGEMLNLKTAASSSVVKTIAVGSRASKESPLATANNCARR